MSGPQLNRPQGVYVGGREQHDHRRADQQDPLARLDDGARGSPFVCGGAVVEARGPLLRCETGERPWRIQSTPRSRPRGARRSGFRQRDR